MITLFSAGKPWRLFPLVALGCALLVGCPASNPDLRYLDRLEIVGNEHLDRSTIMEGIATQEDSLVPFADDVEFDLDTFEEDLERIAVAYQMHGFFDVVVRDYEVIELEHNRLKIFLWIEEGEPYPITRVSVLPKAEDGPPLEIERALLGLEEQRFDQERYLELRDAYSSAYKSIGHCTASVEGEVMVIRNDREVRVRVQAEPGPFCLVDHLVVKGNSGIETETILRHVEIEPGALITPSLISRAERNLFALGQFNMIRIEPSVEDFSETQGEETPEEIGAELLVFVQEKPAQEPQIGAGVGFDPSRQQARLRAEWTHNNFLGGMRTLSLALMGGYAFMPTFYSPDAHGPIGEAKIAFRQPELFDPYLALQLETNYELGFAEGFQYHAPGGKVALDRKLISSLRAILRFEVSFFDFFNVTGTITQSEDNPLGDDFRDPFWLTELVEELVWDGRDNPLDARRGQYLSVAFSQSLPELGSDFSYLSLVVDGRIYFTPWRWLTLAARVRSGFQWEVGEQGAVPLTVRFVSGGANSIRAFEYRKLAPYASSCNDSGDCTYTPVGGLSLLESSFETRFHLLSFLSLALFLDVGDVSEHELDIDFEDLNTCAGFGLRLHTPVGPIRVDFGFRLNDPERYRHLPTWSWYITLGEAF